MNETLPSMPTTLRSLSIALCASLLAAVPAVAHEGHGLPGAAHWHATDTLGLLLVYARNFPAPLGRWTGLGTEAMQSLLGAITLGVTLVAALLLVRLGLHRWDELKQA